MAREPLPLKEDGKPDYTKSKNPIVKWLANYWYFYKTPILIGGFVLILAIWFVVDMVTNVRPDMRVVIIADTLVLDEEQETIKQNVEKFAFDTNNDGKTVVTANYLNLSTDPQDEYQLAAYEQVVTLMIDEDITFYILDSSSYSYMKNSDVVEELSKFGIEYEAHKYRIPINDTFLFNGTGSLKDRAEFYFVMKGCPADKADKEDMQNRIACATELANALIADLEDN